MASTELDNSCGSGDIHGAAMPPGDRAAHSANTAKGRLIAQLQAEGISTEWDRAGAILWAADILKAMFEEGRPFEPQRDGVSCQFYHYWRYSPRTLEDERRRANPQDEIQHSPAVIDQLLDEFLRFAVQQTPGFELPPETRAAISAEVYSLMRWQNLVAEPRQENKRD